MKSVINISTIHKKETNRMNINDSNYLLSKETLYTKFTFCLFLEKKYYIGYLENGMIFLNVHLKKTTYLLCS